MKDCPNCKSHDSMYERWDNYKCIDCGDTYKHKRIAHTVPCRPADAQCGQIIEEWRDHESKEPIQVKSMCNDGTHCTISVSGMKETRNGEYIAVCGIHDD